MFNKGSSCFFGCLSGGNRVVLSTNAEQTSFFTQDTQEKNTRKLKVARTDSGKTACEFFSRRFALKPLAWRGWRAGPDAIN